MPKPVATPRAKIDFATTFLLGSLSPLNARLAQAGIAHWPDDNTRAVKFRWWCTHCASALEVSIEPSTGPDTAYQGLDTDACEAQLTEDVLCVVAEHEDEHRLFTRAADYFKPAWLGEN